RILISGSTNSTFITTGWDAGVGVAEVCTTEARFRDSMIGVWGTSRAEIVSACCKLSKYSRHCAGTSAGFTRYCSYSISMKAAFAPNNIEFSRNFFIVVTVRSMAKELTSQLRLRHIPSGRPDIKLTRATNLLFRIRDHFIPLRNP